MTSRQSITPNTNENMKKMQARKVEERGRWVGMKPTQPEWPSYHFLLTFSYDEIYDFQQINIIGIVIGQKMYLLSNSLRNCGYKRDRIEVEIITEDLGKLLRSNELFSAIPSEAVAQFDSIKFNVQSNGHQMFRLLSILVVGNWVRVVQTYGEVGYFATHFVWRRGLRLRSTLEN